MPTEVCNKEYLPTSPLLTAGDKGGGDRQGGGEGLGAGRRTNTSRGIGPGLRLFVGRGDNGSPALRFDPLRCGELPPTRSISASSTIIL